MPEGRVEVSIGTLSSGQGHETSFAQCVGEWLGVDVDSIRLIQGDTDIVPVGGGSHSARSMRMGGVVMGKASEAVIAEGSRNRRPCAGDRSGGRGVCRRPLHREGHRPLDRPVRGRARGRANGTTCRRICAARSRPTCDEFIRGAGFPFGCAVCEVEIDPDTGHVEIVRYTAIDDVGRAINPLILHGQTHGGIAQGVGQALWEHSHYDPQSGQLLAGSMMDYAMPRAHMLPSFTTELSETLAPGNPLGVRGGGEGGTTPALGVVVNAVVDALSDYGVTHIEMPVTAERVWRAIREGKIQAA